MTTPNTPIEDKDDGFGLVGTTEYQPTMPVEDSQLREQIYLLCYHLKRSVKATEPDATVTKLMEVFQTQCDKAVVEAELKARLVELDLLEQAINSADYMISKPAIERYKMLRLNDLTERLGRLTTPTKEREETDE